MRATAVGRPQWTRLPPPVVRDLPVVIQKSVVSNQLSVVRADVEGALCFVLLRVFSGSSISNVKKPKH